MSEPLYHLSNVVYKGEKEEREDFDGPLDVILLLLSKNKIAIADVSISTILDQYLAYLEEQKRMDMEIASEFIAMASHLMLIKTKMLLSYSEQQEALSEMEQLIRSLTERQQQEAMRRLKQALPFMESHNGIGASGFVKEPEQLTPDRTYRYMHDRADLLAALSRISERRERALPPPVSGFVGVVGKEPYSVTRKAREVLGRLFSRGRELFTRLFEGSKSRSEVVATFLALLELCRVNSVSVSENESGEQTVTFLQMPGEMEEIG